MKSFSIILAILKIEKKRFMSVRLIILLLLLAMVPAAVHAETLFDNGPFSGSQSNLRNTIPHRLFDDFTLVTNSRITGFEWLQHDRYDMIYSATEVSIYNGLPMAANLVFTSNVVATRIPNATGPLFVDWLGFDYISSGLSIDLSAGTYFLGLNTIATEGDSSWDQTTGNSSTIPGRYLINATFPEPGFFFNQDSVFKVIGETKVIPVPGAIFLGSIGVGIVGWLRRRRTL